MTTETQDHNPYVGPRPFERQHKNLFFGRDREAIDVLSLVTAHRVLLIYAQSGAGKTSLINAGLIPLLEDEGFEVFPSARVQGRIPNDIHPAEVTNPYVLNTLISWANVETDTEQLTQTSLIDFLKEREHPTDEIGLPMPRVVIFDQFEELFTTYLERWRDRERFFEQVADALEGRLQGDPLLRAIFVIREDFIAEMDPYALLLPEALRTRYRLERLGEEAALQAVKGPLKNTERTFGPGVAENLVKDLLKIRTTVSTKDKIVEVEGQYVEPVQLQVVCQKLWSSLPAKTTVINGTHLEKFGDVDVALTEFYNNAIQKTIQKTDVKEVTLRKWCEQTLITPMKTRGMVYQEEETTGGIPNLAIDVLVDEHLIRAEYRAGARWYELTHDRFIEPILTSNEKWKKKRQEIVRNPLTEPTKNWLRLEKDPSSLLRGEMLKIAEEWAKAHPADLDEIERTFLEDSRKEWNAARDRELVQSQALAEAEKKASTLLRRLVVALIILVLVAAVVAWWAYRQGQKALANYLLARGQIEFEEEPLLGLALAFEGWERAPDKEDDQTKELLQDSIQIMTNPTARGRLLKLGSNIEGVYPPAPDGSTLVLDYATKPGQVVRLTADSMVTITLTAQVDQVQFSPDGAYLAVKYIDGLAELRSTGDPTDPIPLTGQVDRVEFSPDGAYIAVYYIDGPAELRSTAVPTNPITLTGQVDRVEFSPDGAYLAVYYIDGRAELRSTGDPSGTFKDQVDRVEFSPDGAYLAVNYIDGPAELLKKDGSVLATLTGQVDRVEFSPDGAYLAVNYIDGPAELLKKDGSVLATLTDQVDRVESSPDGAYIAVYYIDGPAELRSTGDPSGTFKDQVAQVEFSPDGAYLAVYYIDGPAELLKKDGSVLATFTDQIAQVKFSPDGAYIAVYYIDGRAELRSTAYPTNPITLTSQLAGVWFSPEPEVPYFAVNYTDSVVPAELRSTGDPTDPIPLTGQVAQVEFSPGELYFIIDYGERRRELWEKENVITPTLLADWPGWSGHFFGPENRLVVWYTDGRAYLLDLKWLSTMGKKFPAAIDLESLQELQGLTCGEEGPFANPNTFFVTRLNDDLKQLPCPQEKSQ